MLTSIIIPTYQHAATLPAAIEAALDQTAPVEVIVVDDGSTDDTFGVMARYSGRIRGLFQTHAGVAAARNKGIGAAHGELVQFLDADDWIAPRKVDRQAVALAGNPRAGWALCDVRVIDAASGRDEPASQRYGYSAMELDGWLGPLLVKRNFIPVHSPLIKREVIGDLRFLDGKLEDWVFWRMIAERAPACYVPEVLAEYRHGKTGRSRGR